MSMYRRFWSNSTDHELELAEAALYRQRRRHAYFNEHAKIAQTDEILACLLAEIRLREEGGRNLVRP